MSAGAELLRREGRSRRAEIVRRLALRRHDGQKAHVEILFPADDCVVRAAEGRIDRPVRQRGAERGELRLGLLVELADVAGEQHVAEAGAGRHLLGESGDLIRHKYAHVRMRRAFGKGRDRVGKRDGGRKVRRDDAAEVQIAQLREQQIVHFVKGPLGKRDIAAPVQIIQN